MLKVLRIIFAILVLIVGAAGIFLPFIPALVLIPYGLYLINPEWVKKKWSHFRSKK